mgnify:FL=1
MGLCSKDYCHTKNDSWLHLFTSLCLRAISNKHNGIKAFLKLHLNLPFREYVSTDAAYAQTCKSLGHHLLHLLILRLLVISAPADFEAQKLPANLIPKACPVPNACPALDDLIISQEIFYIFNELHVFKSLESTNLWHFFTTVSFGFLLK